MRRGGGENRRGREERGERGEGRGESIEGGTCMYIVYVHVHVQ